MFCNPLTLGVPKIGCRRRVLKNIFKDFGDKLAYVIVDDIAAVSPDCPLGREIEIDMVSIIQERAFDSAVVGCDAVIHTASPISFASRLDPQGTSSISTQNTL